MKKPISVTTKDGVCHWIDVSHVVRVTEIVSASDGLLAIIFFDANSCLQPMTVFDRELPSGERWLKMQIVGV